jgi:farnesyl diphosphate synthase
MHNDKFVGHFDTRLQSLIENMTCPSIQLKNAMLYSLFPGGKRLRPRLVYFCGQALHLPLAVLDIIAAAIELTHAYSLIHDDLPAMDNDDWRRGKPSCHRAFDEATAILAGDALQILAVDLLLQHLPDFLSAQQTVQIVRILIKASGPEGMIGGQSLDLIKLNQDNLSIEELSEIHQLKTGQLMLACVDMVIAASTTPSASSNKALRDFAQNFGLVFQMQDDYLDRYAKPMTLGKDRASDAANHKTTFASVYSQQELYQLIQTHFTRAKDALSKLDEHQALLELIMEIQGRSDGL